MAWKCPNCSYSAKGKGAYQKVQKHYYSKHYKPKAGSGKKSRSYDDKKYTFRPKHK